MSALVEYVFASDIAMADRAVRKQGWRPVGRADWLKPDGTEVRFICIVEQLAAIQPGMTVHVVGDAPLELRRLKGACRLLTLST